MSIKLFALFLAVALLTTIAMAEKEIYAVNTANNNELGMYLANETFFTLYRFLSDPQGAKMSTCTGVCAKAWPPFYVEDLTVSPDLKSRDFEVITRDDGTNQLAYKGWPLYLYSGDTKPFEINGQGVNGLWFVVNPLNLTK
jgi:predicted lipoprotein with Yx(FWY)xxD motif